jgi:hypothetical protein
MFLRISSISPKNPVNLVKNSFYSHSIVAGGLEETS